MSKHAPKTNWDLGADADFAFKQMKEMLLSFGIEVDEYFSAIRSGWIQIIRNALEDMFMLGWDGTGLKKINQRFGNLIILIEGLTEEQRDLLDDHQVSGQYTCELCGDYGLIRTLLTKWSSGGTCIDTTIVLCEQHLELANGKNIIAKKT